MATRVRIHKDLEALRRRAVKAGWTVEQTSTNQVEWRDSEGKHVETHSTSLYGGPLIVKIRTKISNALDDQAARERALRAMKARQAGDEALVQFGREMTQTGQQVPVNGQMFSDAVTEPAAPVVTHPYSDSSPLFNEPGPNLPEVEEQLRLARAADAGPRFKPTFTMVSTDALFIDRVDNVINGVKGYQRPIIEEHVLNIAIDFDWDKFGYLELSYRDGRHWILDGQQRAAALELTDRVSDRRKRAVPAMVFTGMTRKDESEYYLAKNTGRKTVHPVHAWMAKLVGDPDAQDIQRIVEANGFRVKMGGHPLNIAAVSRLDQIYADYGPEKLDLTLRALAKAWGHQWVIPAVVLHATSLVFGVFDGVEVDGMAKALASNLPNSWLAWAKTVTAGEKGSQSIWLARRLTEVYDRSRKPENQLRMFDTAYQKWLSSKLSARSQNPKAIRRAELSSPDRPRPGSWLRTVS